MPMLSLHQLNNPTELELIDSAEVADVSDFNGHAVITNHSNVTKYVAETVEQIYTMMMGG